MADIEFYKPLVAEGPRRVESATEEAYLAAWRENALPRSDDLLSMAVLGGLVADRLAWVFLAGYQAACRHAFADAASRSWVAYVAAEDRKGEPPLPGVGATVSGAATTLSGHKTWVAAARTVENLIVKVGSGDEAVFYLIDRARDGLTIDPGPRKTFLADLSQGRATFDGTPVTPDDVLDPGGIRQFGLLEPLYIYAAFCGLVLGSTTEHDLVTCSHDCLDAVEPALASIGPGELDRFNLHKADARAQDLLVRLSGNRIAAEGDWDTDQRLVAMYSRSIRRR